MSERERFEAAMRLFNRACSAWSDVRLGPHHACAGDITLDRLERAGLAEDAAREALTALFNESARSDAQNGVGQPEAPTAAPLDEDAIGALAYRGNTVSYMYDRAKAYGDEIMRCWFVLKAAGLHPGRTDDVLHEVLRKALAHPPARSVADPTGRTPTDYALEFAEYMAKGAEQFIEAVNLLSRCEQARDDAKGAGSLAVNSAKAVMGEFMTRLRSDIYEFRKRRAIARSGAGSEEAQPDRSEES